VLGGFGFAEYAHGDSETVADHLPSKSDFRDLSMAILLPNGEQLRLRHTCWGIRTT
jgi:hypothetical protein